MQTGALFEPAVSVTTTATCLSAGLLAIPPRPPGPVVQRLKPVLPVTIENLVAGLAGYAEIPAQRRRSSITELAFHGIYTSRQKNAKSVTHVSGTKCHLCLGPLT